MPMPYHKQERSYSVHERLVDEITHQIDREVARPHTDGMLDNAKHLLHRGGEKFNKGMQDVEDWRKRRRDAQDAKLMKEFREWQTKQYEMKKAALEEEDRAGTLDPRKRLRNQDEFPSIKHPHTPTHTRVCR